MGSPNDCEIVDPNGDPIGDVPIRTFRSYIDCVGGSNPMGAAFNNCFIRSRLGIDPVTGKSYTVFQEQVNRELQILESLGELVYIYRRLIVPDQSIDARRCPLCWDPIRKEARSSCPLCNGFGVVTNNQDVNRVGGFQLLTNPDRTDGMFWMSRPMAAQKLTSNDIGLQVDHTLSSCWTVPIRNCLGEYTNILDQRDIIIRYVFNQETNTKFQELGRYEILDTSYSLGPGNYLMHLSWTMKKIDAGISQKEYALPNFL